jgi:hypothetical protein
MTVPTLDCYLDGAQHLPPGGQKTSARPFITTGIRWLKSYSPAVGQTAVILRGTGLRKTDRVAIATLE